MGVTIQNPSVSVFFKFVRWRASGQYFHHRDRCLEPMLRSDMDPNNVSIPAWARHAIRKYTHGGTGALLYCILVGMPVHKRVTFVIFDLLIAWGLLADFGIRIRAEESQTTIWMRCLTAFRNRSDRFERCHSIAVPTQAPTNALHVMYRNTYYFYHRLDLSGHVPFESVPRNKWTAETILRSPCTRH